MKIALGQRVELKVRYKSRKGYHEFKNRFNGKQEKSDPAYIFSELRSRDIRKKTRELRLVTE